MKGYFSFTGYELEVEKERLVSAIQQRRDIYRNRILLRYVSLLLDSYPAKGLSMGDRFSDLPANKRMVCDYLSFWSYFDLQENIHYLARRPNRRADALAVLSEMRIRRFLKIAKQDNLFNALWRLGVEEEF